MTDESATYPSPTTMHSTGVDQLSLVFRDGATLETDDIPAVLDVVHRSLGDHSQQTATFNPLCWFGKVVVAYHDDVPVCVIQGLRNWHDVTQMQITTVSVDPDFQGHGVLVRTLAHLIDVVQRDAITQLAVRLPADHRAMFKVFVEKAGFAVYEWIDSCFGPCQDRIYLVKSLIPGLGSPPARQP